MDEKYTPIANIEPVWYAQSTGTGTRQLGSWARRGFRRSTTASWVQVLGTVLLAANLFLHCFRGPVVNPIPEHDVEEAVAAGKCSSTNVAPEFDWYKLKPSENVTWTDCYDGHKCARVSLPLDYSTPSGPKTHIALRMLPATDKQNYLGTIFLNPGGPGGSGTDLMERGGKLISTIVGPRFDVLGFDPRGIGATTPLAQCFDSDSQFKIWELSEGRILNISDWASVTYAKARQEVLGERCARILGGDGEERLGASAEEWGPGRFMNTPNVATDMLKISELLGQEKLQFWGFSYGSVLGQYFSSMYPDKVGRVVIDGVMDAVNYRQSLWSSNLADTDAVAGSFYQFCTEAGPEKCPVAEKSVPDTLHRVQKIFQDFAANPIPIPFGMEGPLVSTSESLHAFMLEAVYSPIRAFPLLASGLAAIEQRNASALTNLTSGGLFSAGQYSCSCEADIPWKNPTEGFYAVACADGDPISDGPEEFREHYEKLSAMSSFAGPIWSLMRFRCGEWKLPAKWRFTDPFGGNTSHPILIVQPTWDPVCPLSDAVKVRARFPGAGLVEQRSYGHCSLSATSICTARTIREYFVNGTLPEEGKVCQVDELPILGNVRKDVHLLSLEDMELLEASKALARVDMPKLGL